MPEVQQVAEVEGPPVGAEWVEVAPARLHPIDELNAELVRALGPTEKFEFVQAQRLVELFDRRNRRFADTDDADLFGLDQRNATTRLQDVRQGRSRHPTGRAATGDDDAGQFAIFGAHSLPGRGYLLFRMMTKRACAGSSSTLL